MLRAVISSVNLPLIMADLQTRHRASTNTRWYFAFGAVLSRQRNPYTVCKSAQ